ncbi:hypothetical protein [Cerina litoralis]|nr:hypothetical protein [Cerina litoralis]
MKIIILLIITCLAFTVSGCSNIQGTYLGQEGALMDKIIIKEGLMADIVFLGSVTEVSYEKTGDKIKFMIPDGAQILTIDQQGCLDGGTLVGRYCKD